MTKKKVQESLGELADMAERDHEVQMARAQLYKLAKYSIKLHDMLKQVTEAEGIEGWQQAKITKASDYISSVYHSLDYDTKFDEKSKIDTSAMVKAAKESTDPYKSRLHSKLAERTLTKSEEEKREKNVKGMKKNSADFKKRYGKDADSVMYATATKQAKKK